MNIAIWNENTLRAGRAVGPDDLERHGDDCGDWTVYDDTPEKLLEVASLIEENARSGGGGLFDRRAANSIREEVYDYQPLARPHGFTNPADFVEWANTQLQLAGIGTYDNGTMWYHYQLVDDDPNILVVACDYNETIPVLDWQSVSELQLHQEAQGYIDATA